jgi:NTP pyrophosphatase (non-canonical NTP hydrolase)
MNEPLVILAEECAELIQAIQKLHRFGYHNARNRKRLEEEVGDVIALLMVLESEGFIDEKSVNPNIKKKLRKLKKYSEIEELDAIIKKL